MLKKILNTFQFCGNTYQYYLDGETGIAHLSSDNGVVYTIDLNGCMTDSEGELGRFFLNEKNLWDFRAFSGNVFETGNKSRLKAEMKIFKFLLE